MSAQAFHATSVFDLPSRVVRQSFPCARGNFCGVQKNGPASSTTSWRRRRGHLCFAWPAKVRCGGCAAARRGARAARLTASSRRAVVRPHRSPSTVSRRTRREIVRDGRWVCGSALPFMDGTSFLRLPSVVDGLGAPRLLESCCGDVHTRPPGGTAKSAKSAKFNNP